ncbi:MAG: uroporphyrinogen decarboxylase [bacterium]|nr:uroporphyrinogen decarboxylase [bacterium]
MKTGVERIACLFEGKLPDRVPVFCNLLDQGAEHMGMPIKEYYSNGQHIAEAQVQLRKKYGYDAVWGFSYMGYMAEALGCRNIIYSDHGPPNVGHMVIKKFKDIETFEVPDNIEESPAFREVVRSIRLLKKEVGGKYLVVSPTQSCLTLPTVLMGMEKWMELLLMGPESLRDRMLEQCSLFCVRHIEALRNAGADCIPYANPMASMDLMDIGTFKTFALKWIKKDLDAVGQNHSNGDIVYFSGGGRINATIPLLLENVKTAGFYLNPMDDVGEAKSLVGGRSLVGGVINDIKLMTWSKEDIVTEVKRIITAGAPGGRFLFGTLVMPLSISPEKIHAMLQAVYKYGNYSTSPIISREVQ